MRNAVLAALLASACSVACGATEDDLRVLVEQGKMGEAYRLGHDEPEHLGEPAFDFYFGIAALEAGYPGEGVLALERYVLRFPDNRNARLNLARGYFILGEDERARDEFEALAPGATPEERAQIEHFLDAVRARESRYRPTAQAWIEAGVGYDSNVNAGVSSGSLINIPGLIASPQAPNSVSVKTSDGFATLAFGGAATRPIAPGLALFGAASVDSRTYFSSQDDVFNQVSYGANGGLSWLTGKDLFRGGVSVAREQIDSQNYVLVDALTGEWVHQADQFNRYALDASYGRQEFSDLLIYGTIDKTGPRVDSGSSLTTNDYVSISGDWTHVFSAMWNPVVVTTLGYSHEHNLEMRPDFSRDIYTARAQVSATPVPRWTIVLGATYYYDHFGGRFAEVSTASRHDQVEGADAGVTYQIARAWSARAELTWNEQSSDIGLFDYDRFAFAAKLRYEFK